MKYDLSALVPELVKFRNEREWEQFHRPKDLVLAIGIEVGELQEQFLWREGEKSEDIVSDKERYHKISEEVADIAIYLLYFCHDLNINLPEAIKSKLKKNEDKYPSEKFRGRF